MSFYSYLVPDTQTVAEQPHYYQYFTERHLQAMWLEQKYFKDLTTATGEFIEVLSPGIWNAEAGPDFLKAHIRIGFKEYRGSIELHLSDEGWEQHGHHTDIRYDDVILHISLWQPKQIKPLFTKKGVPLLRSYIEPSLTIPIERILRLIDLDLYPYKQFIGSGKCSQTLFRSLPREEIVTLLKSAAEWRLEQKKAYLAMREPTPSLQFACGIAMALGYKHNAEALLELFSWLYRVRPHSWIETLAFALRACGFFEEKYKDKWKDSPLYQQLASISLPVDMPQIKLKLNQIRPLNHPIRRLVYLAYLVSDISIDTLLQRLLHYWSSKWTSCHDRKSFKKLFEDLQDLLPVYVDPYWNKHFLFETNTTDTFLPLMGQDLKKEILVNAFLPMLHSNIAKYGDSQEKDAFTLFYMAISAAQTGKTKYLIHRFFGETSKGSILKQAMSQQGAYQLHHDFCINFEASCEGCPFVDRYKAHCNA